MKTYVNSLIIGEQYGAVLSELMQEISVVLCLTNCMSLLHILNRQTEVHSTLI